MYASNVAVFCLFSSIFDKLEKKGASFQKQGAKRSGSKKDRRINIVESTEIGRKAMKKAEKIVIKTFEELKAGISVKEEKAMIKVANKLNQHANIASPLNVLIQVNLEGEASKGGVAPDQLADLASDIDKLENLAFRGLMFMPKVHTEFTTQRKIFGQATALFENLKRSFPDIDHISMGMSGDLQAAIAEGATMVRVGTALFGPRQ